MSQVVKEIALEVVGVGEIWGGIERVIGKGLKLVIQMMEIMKLKMRRMMRMRMRRKREGKAKKVLIYKYILTYILTHINHDDVDVEEEGGEGRAKKVTMYIDKCM
jgi:hypothetical protein